MIKSFISVIIILLFKIFSPNPLSAQVSESTELKIDSLLNLMTLEEKTGMIHGNSSFTTAGVDRLGIPELVMSDGPHGVRLEHGRDWKPDKAGNDTATYLPTGVTLAATWNPKLGYEAGKVLGNEAKARGKDIILGPGVNIHRTPLNGRNFEYLSEDPYLASIMAVEYIKGVQDQGIAACVKHYLANNQEFLRDRINVEMSERALREIYLPAFEAAVVNGKVLSVMGAYNKFRGQFATHHKYLINDILKGEFGFKGIVISDWGAVHNTMEAINNGTDIEMGSELGSIISKYNNFYLADSAILLTKTGKVSEKIIDDKVRRILRVMYQTKLAENKIPGSINTREHQDVALSIAQEGIVLLKNEGVLPIDNKKVKTIAIIGANATRKHAMAGGSSQVLAKYEITPLEGITAAVGEKVKLNFAPGYKIGKKEKGNDAMIKAAVKIAENADVVIYVGGSVHGYTDKWNDNAYDAENIDKPDMKLPFGQDVLLNKILNTNKNTIVILYGGGPLDMSSWKNDAKGIIQAWYPGMEGGKALAQIIFGSISPSGKLPVSFPAILEDSPAHKLGEYPGDGKTVNYKEDIFVGYRYFDTYKVQPAFPFGFGLSYTSFRINVEDIEKTEKTALVKVKVQNTGSVAGAEVVQLYIKDLVSSMERPDKELKSFEKVFLEPGESKIISLYLNERAFSYYNDKTKSWVLEPGTFEILIGNSSDNIVEKREIQF